MNSEAQPTLRPEIQALRSVAVLAVVLYHLWPERVTGGYVGVDVFFVISGFLITGHLWRDLESTGSIRLAAFWQRRARRLLPAALLVIGVCVVAVVLLVPFSYWDQFLGESIAATLYVENWALAASAVDYLAAENGASLVQHYWSLSVEEQFYIVWPLLLVGLLAVARGIRSQRRTTAVAGLAVVTATSLAWSVIQTGSEPGIAYFSTATRVWEFGVGGLLALVAIRTPLPGPARTVGSLVGVGMIVAAVVTFDTGTAFPGVAAILPVAGTALVISAGTPRNVWGGVIALRPVQFVGTISYSFYLWHWPPIAIALVLAEEMRAPLKMAILAGALLAAWLTYRFVEIPFRARVPSPRRGLAVAAGAMATTCLIAITPVIALGTANDMTVNDRPFADSDEISALIESADSLAMAPTDVLGAAAGPVPEWVHDRCLDIDDRGLERCEYGDPEAPYVAAVVGDSIGASWLPALRQALDMREWRIQVLTLGQCPVAEVSLLRNDGDVGFRDECNEHREWVRTVLLEIEPDLIVASQSSSAVNYLASGAVGDAAVAEWRAGLEDGFGSLAALATPVVVLGRPEFGQRPAGECVGLLLKVESCVGRFPEESRFAELEQEAAEAAGLSWIPTRHWLCSDANDCPPVIGGSPVTADGSHLTWEYSLRLSTVVGDSLRGIDEVSALPGVG